MYDITVRHHAPSLPSFALPRNTATSHITSRDPHTHQKLHERWPAQIGYEIPAK